jgi:hypothetical protein
MRVVLQTRLRRYAGADALLLDSLGDGFGCDREVAGDLAVARVGRLDVVGLQLAERRLDDRRCLLDAVVVRCHIISSSHS